MEPCEVLAWDTAHFGVKVARVKEGAPLEVGAVRRFCVDHGVECLYWTTSFQDHDPRFAVGLGLELMDVKVTLDRALAAGEGKPDLEPGVVLRPGRASDAEQMEREAVVGFRGSRFYRDLRFARDRVEALYEVWWRKSLSGELAQAVCVAEVGGRPVAYATAAAPQGGREASIGLVGVAPAWQGRRLGGAVVSGLCAELGGMGLERVRVPTQASNVQALRLYERLGFRVCETRLIYHGWFGGGA
jgi:dTDP-4-amino-4,6-dideoxy-D-galactose acyltransferase